MKRIRRPITFMLTMLTIVAGLALGLALYTFVYAEGYSYMTNDPEACANCHVMDEQLAAWRKSSHHAVAVCNDCHAPDDFFGKYATKAINGYNHSLAFTLGGFAEPIRITARNREVTEGACRRCHSALVEPLEHAKDPISCIRCHPSVGHMH